MNRSEVRTAGRSARHALQGPARAQAEAQLVHHLDSLTALRSGAVGAFVAHDGEPDLQPVVSRLWDQGRTVALPVLRDDPDDFSMRFLPWEPNAPLMPGRYGIEVPRDAPAIVPATLLVSLTGFDPRGNRIGRGAGFFDRYLASYSGTVVGVGFEVQRFAAIPTEAHDEPLSALVTDLGVRFFGRR